MPHGIPGGALNVTNLRQYLGEPIPAGGTEEDTMFTDGQLTELIADVGGDWSHALSDGWSMKAAAYAGMVDIAEGTAKRALSDLHEHALNQVKFFSEGGAGGSRQAVIHQIVRR